MNPCKGEMGGSSHQTQADAVDEEDRPWLRGFGGVPALVGAQR
jgi:hypothetical protein